MASAPSSAAACGRGILRKAVEGRAQQFEQPAEGDLGFGLDPRP